MSDPKKQCTCSPGQILKYQQKISGPILDRLDLQIEVPRLNYEELAQEKVAESSEVIRQRVEKARQIQQKRFDKSPNLIYNTEMRTQEIKEFCQLDSQSEQILKNAVNRYHLSARAYHRILKLSRTIADLAQCDKIKLNHLAEALQYKLNY